jgi:hypothetical protein
MTGPLKNSRHERFAQERAKGKTKDEAYTAAGYAENRSNACRVDAKPQVQARIAELQARAAEKAEVTVADIARQLDADREFAREQGQGAAAISATLGKAKLLGLMPERHEHTGRGGGPIEYQNLSDEEVAARIAAHEQARGKRPTAH